MLDNIEESRENLIRMPPLRGSVNLILAFSTRISPVPGWNGKDCPGFPDNCKRR